MIDAALPWAPWDLSGIRAHATSAPQDELLAIVRSQEKESVGALADVPSGCVTSSRVTSRMERPKSLRPTHALSPWLPQISDAFVLHLADGFIGDNVVFDRERYYGLGRWWLGDTWALYAGTREVRHVDVGVSIGGWGGEAFQHCIMDALPKLAAVLDLLESPRFANATIVSHLADAPTAQWFWQKLGLADRVVQKPKDARAGFVVHADLVLYPDVDPSLGSYGLYPRRSLRPLQRRLGTLDPGGQNLVLYLARGGRRSVANEAALLARLRTELQGTPYALETFRASGDLDRDMALVGRAKIVLGPHGGAFANLIFARPGTHVIEFHPVYRLYATGTAPRAGYWGLAQAAGLDYWTVAPDDFDFDKPGMVVDVDEVAGILRHLLH